MDRVMAEALIIQIPENENHLETLPGRKYPKTKKCQEDDNYLKTDNKIDRQRNGWNINQNQIFPEDGDQTKNLSRRKYLRMKTFNDDNYYLRLWRR